MSDKCDPIRSKLQALELQLKNTEKYIVEPDPGNHHPPKPKLNPAYTKLSNTIISTRSSLQACEESLIPNTPVPVTLTLTKFQCLDQSDDIRIVFGINTENDEPYAVAFAVDLKMTNVLVGSVPVGAINSKMTLVGPLAKVNVGEYGAPANIIWGLNNASDKITSADNLIILVAMMENDSGSPAQVRTVLEKAAQLSLLTNVPALASKQISRQELVSRIIADMTGAMGSAKVGVPDPDDNIGAIQELRFSQEELNHIYRNLGGIEKSLTFTGDDAKYILSFRMFR